MGLIPGSPIFWTQPTSKHFPDSINVQAFSGLNQRPSIFRTQPTSKHFPGSSNSNLLSGLNPGYTDSEVVFDLVSDVGGWSKISARKTLHMKCRHNSTSFSSRRSQ